jgi:hypothetical protein
MCEVKVEVEVEKNVMYYRPAFATDFAKAASVKESFG